MKARIAVRKLQRTGRWHYKIWFFSNGHPDQILSNDIGKGYASRDNVLVQTVKVLNLLKIGYGKTDRVYI